MKYLSVCLFFLFALHIESQNNTIAAGEKLTFTASYNMSGLLTDLAQVTMQTSVDWIFAGGDAVLGPETAAKAIYQAKEAAESMIRYLEGRDLKEGRIPEAEE